MLAIAFRFLTGRYHATPWGRHVNEAAAEWPPSPWRLLRSLVATWKRKLPDRLRLTEVEGVLRALAAEPPRFVLPPAVLGHTRHFMPWFKTGPEDRTLVFDGFVAPGAEQEVVAVWAGVHLGAREDAALDALLEHLGFFGRAESWCEARRCPATEAASLRANAWPLDPGHEPPPGYEAVRTLGVDPSMAFELASPSGDRATGRAQRPRGSAVSLAAALDPPWNLCVETAQLHAAGLSDAPGSRWIVYARPTASLQRRPRALPTKRLERPRPQVARYALDSAVLPPVEVTLKIGEQARAALMGRYGRLTTGPDGVRGRSTTFSGRAANGKRTDDHQHARYLPTDEDGDGRLDHLTVVAVEGFGPAELAALDGLSHLADRDRDAAGHPLRLLLTGVGRLDELRSPPLAASAVWASATPFLAPRHVKMRGRKRDPDALRRSPDAFLLHVLGEEIARWIARRPELGDLRAEDIEVEPLRDGTAYRIGARRLRPIEFKRFRERREDDGGRRAAGAFRLRFPRSVSGPIALGHSSHFGIGLFLPEDPADGAR